MDFFLSCGRERGGEVEVDGVREEVFRQARSRIVKFERIGSIDHGRANCYVFLSILNTPQQ